MADYGIQAASLSQAIHVGRINKAGTAFTSKDDLTDEALYAVAQFVRRHFAGSMSMTFSGINGAEDFTLTVTTDPRTGADHASV
jgi:hypothetical protein